MKLDLKRMLVLLAVLALSGVPNAFSGISTFDDLSLAPQSHWNGNDDGSGYGTYSGFTSGDNYFVNYRYTGWDYWDGFAYSNTTDTTTTGVANQFSAITGSGAKDSANYAVAYTLGMSGQPAQTYNGYATGEYAQFVDGFYVTNTTWAYQSMLSGDVVGKAFGGADGTDADWFLLTVYGLDESYSRTDDYVEFYLADYRFADSGQDYIIDTWTWVDLSALGLVYGLEFQLSSSDGGSGYSMNTPAYFAMDDLTTRAVPVPAGAWLLGSGLIGLIGFRRRTHHIKGGLR